ncbi:hypothetical protein CAPTEDRAFT_214463 [Capitella teleta]|uniref:CCHC-type domain-containing protein n=1 Tax=Capitella teleta TaxID=283909 RepID=R7UYK2_CAPTE|nr:hypothetical protein CAPTEDRAFT_214463 [Capitella teleta]|eukprot:ELU09012.1 hypothetical protein CAPTEDRAFT_214463 [Capitella teleta]
MATGRHRRRILAIGPDVCVANCKGSCKGKKSNNNNDKNTVGIWNCMTCRNTPEMIAEMMQLMTQLQTSVDTLQIEITELREENVMLHAQLTASVATRHSDPSSKEISSKKTLVDTLDTETATFDTVVCCIGTNDCGRDSFASETFSDDMEKLIVAAKGKVKDPASIVFASIPPRMDSKRWQRNVDIANGCISSLATKEGVSFVNNDPSFKRADGSPNDGYLLMDRLHLNRNGSKRLILNMGVPIMDTANGDIARKSKDRKQHKKKTADQKDNKQKRSETSSSNADADRWKLNHQDQTSTNQHDSQRTNNRRCLNCGEENHSFENCRHEKGLVCHSCGRYGHKAKFCKPT